MEARQDDSKRNLLIKKEAVPDDMSKYGMPIEQSEVAVVEPEELRIVLAIDVSGSMCGTPMRDAKNAMLSFLEQIDFSSSKVSIVAVANHSIPVAGLTSNKNECIQAINRVDTVGAGGGNSVHPFDTILSTLKNEKGRRYAIILADGVWSYQDKAIQAAKICHSNNIETAAIGFGGADYKFLKAISSNDANALMVTQEELTQAFGTIAQSMSNNSNSVDTHTIDTLTWD